MDHQPDAEAWLADARSDEAARSRSRKRWLSQQAAESATLVGALADLADAGREVVLATRAGSEHRARVAAVGRDVVRLRTDAGTVLVPLTAVTVVHAGPAAPVPSDDRPPPSAVTLLAALEQLRDDEADVVVRTGDGRSITGRLEAVGVDVATVRSGSAPGALAYVPLDALLEVAASG